MSHHHQHHQHHQHHHVSAKHLEGTTLGMHPELYPYVMQHIREDPIQRRLREDIEKESSANMAGAPDEAAFFNWFLPMINARIAIEVGAFRGSTTLQLAQALPAGGKVYALDVSEEYLATGRGAWAAAGVTDRIEVVIAPALETLNKLLQNPEVAGKTDFVFIDADKGNYGAYYEAAVQLVRPGGVIAVDNVLWGGNCLKPESEWTAETKAITSLNEAIKNDARVVATMLPIADGVYLCRKR